jgi:predicted nucleic acid-binding protein
MRIYLDNCCYNRPFDDQTHIRIAIETQAKQYIQHLIVEKQVELVISYMSHFENGMNPSEVKKEAIQAFFANAPIFLDEKYAEPAGNIAYTIMRLGVKQKDALHLACSILAKCDYFITTDDDIVKKYTEHDIIVINPVDFLKILEANNA